jgi:hypothetical protein
MQERRQRWLVLRNGEPVGLSPPNPLSAASAHMLAEVLSHESPEDELSVVAWTGEESSGWDARTDTVVRFRGGVKLEA